MSLSIAISTARDGSMKNPGAPQADVLPARTAFLQKNGIQPEDTTLVHLTYDSNDFCRYHTVTDAAQSDGITSEPTIIADALVVTEPHHALFIPLADCIAAIIHDPMRSIMMLSHLGRQNLEQAGGTKCIEYLVCEHGVDASHLTVWLSPAAGKESYPLFAFDNKSLHEVATEQLTAAGVKREHITASPIDVATNHDYFSHSQFLAGKRDTDGRHAVVAVMR